MPQGLLGENQGESQTQPPGPSNPLLCYPENLVLDDALVPSRQLPGARQELRSGQTNLSQNVKLFQAALSLTRLENLCNCILSLHFSFLIRKTD